MSRDFYVSDWNFRYVCIFKKNVNLYILCSNGWIPGKHESYTKTTGFVDVSWLLC